MGQDTEDRGMTVIERGARALALEQSGVDEWDALDEAFQERLKEQVRAVVGAIREPSEGMVATVVQAVGDPTPDQWALGERANATLTTTNMLGETACAEVVRDWQAMIDAALTENERRSDA